MHIFLSFALLVTILVLSTGRIISHDHKVGGQSAATPKAYHFSVVTEHKVASNSKQETESDHAPVTIQTWGHSNGYKKVTYKGQKGAAYYVANGGHKGDHDKNDLGTTNLIINADKDFENNNIKIKSGPVDDTRNVGYAKDSRHYALSSADKPKTFKVTVHKSVVTH